jgi:alkylresorcinol/alkylpyrone synthase
MQRRLPQARAGNRADPRLDIDILSVATANPGYRIDQRKLGERAQVIFPHLARVEALFTNTGIESRYSCVPADWRETPHRWEEHTATYQRHALDLLQLVSVKAIAEAGLLLADIVLAIPSLDANLKNPPGLPPESRAPVDLRTRLRWRRRRADARRGWHMRARTPMFYS